jgi:alkylation response protein AidB-like acyl-CoA dehydrogenase
MEAPAQTRPSQNELGELPERARALVPTLRGREIEAEKARVLHAETISEIRDAGLFRVLQPRRYGGLGGTLPDMIDLAREIGRGSSAAAWVFGNVALHSWIIGMCRKEAQDEIWADTTTITSSCLRPVCTAKPVPGGFTIGGRWPYVSGADHTQWTILGIFVPGEGTSKQPAYALVPRSDYKIDDEWHVTGLAATGSRDLIIEECFVPEHRVMTAAQANSGKPPGAELHDVPLYRIPLFSSFSFFIAAPIVGMGYGAIDQYVEMVRGRETAGGAAGGGDIMANLQTVQLRVGEAEMRVDAAHALLQRAAADTMAAAASSSGVTTDQRIRNRRAQVFATRLITEAIDEIYEASGASGIFVRDPTQRLWRDIHAGSKHFSLNWDAMRVMCGQFSLGLQPTIRMY